MNVKKSLVIGLIVQAPFVFASVPGLPAFGQPQMQAPGQGQPYETGVAMTLYRVVNGPNGQYYVNQQGQSIPLPGAGVNSPAVAIYSGSYGGQWYVDQTGQQIDLPQASPAYGGAGQPAYYGGQGYGAQQPYQGGYPQGQYQQGYAQQGQYGQDQYNQQQQAQQQPQVNVEQNSGGGGSAVGTGLAAVAGSALGSMAGAAMMDSYMGMPYGTPMYGGYGGGGPYYNGAGGKRVYVNNTNNNYNAEWQNQHNWYHNQVNDPNGRYNKNNWSGQDHGMPQNGNNQGRLYSQNPDGNMSGDKHGDDKHGGFGGDKHEGGYGGDKQGGFGGHREDGGGFHGGGRRR